jgi:hypothetical protein
MKKVKYITQIAAAAVVAFCATSCEEWLDMPSETKYDSSSIFVSPEKAEMAVLAAYASAYHSDLNYRLMSGTDECMATERTNSKYPLSQYVAGSENVPDGVYTTMYTTIERTNSCIKGLSSMDLDNPRVAQLLGEAYALRAWAYFNVVRFWGDVPFQIIPTVEAETFELPRTDRDVIYDQCIADLQEAVRLTHWKSEMNLPSERISKSTAYGILSRVALYAAGYSLRWNLDVEPQYANLAKRDDAARITELYTIARDACQEVITNGGHTLLANYDQIYRDIATKKYNNETMWEYGVYGASQSSQSPGYTSGISVATNTFYSKGGPQIAPMPTLYFDYDTLDQRRDVSICSYAINNGATLMATMVDYAQVKIGKYRVTWKSDNLYGDGRTNINMPLLRYSDVLLMFAEADNELNGAPSTAAKDAYEEVRKRAFRGDVSKIGATPTDKDGFFNAIVNERKLELCFEGGALRRTDLVRWGIHYTVLTAEAERMKRLGAATGEYANLNTYAAYREEKMDKYEHPTIAIPVYKYFKGAISTTDTAGFADAGYSVVDLRRNLYTTDAKTEVMPWVNEFFIGVTYNKTELLPLSNNMMNDNPMIRDQQHPGY